jgi:putative ABC transport system substrate-binding protein
MIRSVSSGFGAILWVLVAALPLKAQPTTGPRIGFVEAGSRSANQHLLDAFRRGLRDLGYVEGQSIVIEDRWADGRAERFPELIADLVRLKAAVIAVASTPGAVAAKQSTNTIPVVIWGVSDPVGIGVVASLGRPGGNITGVALGTEEGLSGKRIELLKEAVPALTRVAVLWNPDAPGLQRQITELGAAATTLKVALRTFEVRSVSEFDPAFGAISKEHVGGLVVVVDPLTFRHREDVVRLANQARLPTMYGFSEFSRIGGLMAFGPSVPEQAFRAAAFVDKILRGAKPADLPVERPTRFELVINMRTAKALGVMIPPSLLLKADQAVE